MNYYNYTFTMHIQIIYYLRSNDKASFLDKLNNMIYRLNKIRVQNGRVNGEFSVKRIE